MWSMICCYDVPGSAQKRILSSVLAFQYADQYSGCNVYLFFPLWVTSRLTYHQDSYYYYYLRGTLFGFYIKSDSGCVFVLELSDRLIGPNFLQTFHSFAVYFCSSALIFSIFSTGRTNRAVTDMMMFFGGPLQAALHWYPRNYNKKSRLI